MSSPILLFEHVSKWYGPVLALNHVTLELQGGITGLVGANGAGKSTLIKLAVGQATPTLGKVRVRGIDASHWTARRIVGYCPDHDSFYEDMTGRDFVLTMAKLTGLSASDAQARTGECLDLVGMADRSDRPVSGYSKGMRQRIKLAQAMLLDPELLVLDEPLSGIDPIGRQELIDLFQTLIARGKCLLISSHELEELEKLTSHVAIMARGRIAAVGTLDRIRDMLDGFPMSVKIEVDRPRELASRLMELEETNSVDCTGPNELIVKAWQPKRFYPAFGKVVLDGDFHVRQMIPLDDSTHAILGYLLGGSGRT